MVNVMPLAAVPCWVESMNEWNGVIQLLLLLVVAIYTVLTFQLVMSGKRPAVSFWLEQVGGRSPEIRFVLVNHTPLSVAATIHMKTILMGEPVTLPGKYSGGEEWPLLPKDKDCGAAFLIAKTLEPRFPKLAEHVASLVQLKGHLGPQNINIRNIENSPMQQATQELQEVLAWEEEHKDHALKFEISLTCKTHRVWWAHVSTLTRKWCFSLTRMDLILDV